jgi:hypothetical protein
MAFIIRDDGTVVDNAVTDIDFTGFFTVISVGPGTAQITLDTAIIDERIRDIVAAALVAGNGVLINVNDPANSITLSASYAGSSGDLGVANTLARSDHTHTVSFFSRTSGPITINNGTQVSANSACLAGEQVTSCGFSTSCGASAFWLQNLDSGNGCTCRLLNNTGGTCTLTSIAYCREQPMA